MKGLFLKDLYNLKQQGKFLLFFLIIWGGFSIVSRSLDFFSGAICLLSVTIPISAYAYDERAKWDAYCLTMPTSRKQIAFSKYLLGLATLLFGFTLCFVFIGFAKGFALQSFFPLLIVAGFAVIVLSIMLPLLFKFGTEKGRILLMIVCFVPMVLAFASQSLSKLTIPPEFLAMLPFLFILAVILIFIDSILLSFCIYQKKEL